MKLKSREEELKSIIRYKQNTVCKPMFYTPDLYIHISRVVWIAEEVCRELSLDNEISGKIIRRCMFHDDAEIIAGDIATPVKQNWSQKEKDEYEKLCQNAIPILVEAYGEDLGEDYEAILIEMENSNNEGENWESNLIHAIIEYCDKLDALMEVNHELYSGSSSFLKSLKDTFHFDTNGYEYVLDRVKKRRLKIEELLGKNVSHKGIMNLQEATKININSITEGGTQHTIKSVCKATGNEIYDLWRELHFIHGSLNQQSHLYTQNIT